MYIKIEEYQLTPDVLEILQRLQLAQKSSVRIYIWSVEFDVCKGFGEVPVEVLHDVIDGKRCRSAFSFLMII
jgi:hypothetical protein